MHAERRLQIRIRYGRGGFAGLRRAQLGAAKPGCACKRNPDPRSTEAPQSKHDIDPFIKEEQSALLAQSTGQGRNLLQFAFWTGLRTSDLKVLDWPDVDLVRGVLMVTRALSQHSKAVESTKTNAGRSKVNCWSAPCTRCRIKRNTPGGRAKKSFESTPGTVRGRRPADQ